MNRRKFLKILAAVGAVPSMGMLKPAPKPDLYLGTDDWAAFYDINWNNPIFVSDYANASLQYDANGRILEVAVARYRKRLDREILRACGIPPQYVLGNTDFLAYVDPDAPSWRVLT